MGVETMMMAAAVASAGGQVLEGVDAFQRSRYEAAVLENQAEAARRDAGVEIQLNLEEGAREIGRGITIAAKSGGGGEGSAFDVLADFSRQNIYEVQRLAVAGDNASRAAMADAKQAKRAGNFALAGSVIKAGATLAGAPNARGDGTLLSDAIDRRRQRGGNERRSTPQPMRSPAPARGSLSRPLVNAPWLGTVGR